MGEVRLLFFNMKKERIKESLSKFSFAVSLLIIGTAVILWSDVHVVLLAIEEWVTHAGVQAPFWFMGILTVFTIFFLPVLQLGIFSGVAFGGVLGSLYFTIGSMIGATIAFWIARELGYKLVRRFLSSYIEKLDRVEAMIERNGLVAVIVLRLVPVFPFSGLSFFFGLTSVRFRDFFLGTFIGNIPWTIVYVYFGNSIREQNVIQVFTATSIVLIGILLAKMYKEL